MSNDGTLDVESILAWADAHRRRTGRWPHAASGADDGLSGHTWRGANTALIRRGDSLAGLLNRHRRGH
jgi:hypothetical protein